jgi:HD-like signal output (HDOD) protein
MSDLKRDLVIPTWAELPGDVRSKWSARIDKLPPAPPLLGSIGSLGLNLRDFDARELAETIIIGYLMETGFSRDKSISDEHRNFIHGWTAGASVIAFRWGQKVELSDPSTASTVALLCRVGSLMLGSVEPKPSAEYQTMESETARLRYEIETWGIASPVLSAELIRNWELPLIVADMCAQTAYPIIKLCPPDPLDPYPRILTVIAASLVIADLYLRGVDIDEMLTELKENPDYQYLAINLESHRLLHSLTEAWQKPSVQRELASVTK